MRLPNRRFCGCWTIRKFSRKIVALLDRRTWPVNLGKSGANNSRRTYRDAFHGTRSAIMWQVWRGLLAQRRRSARWLRRYRGAAVEPGQDEPSHYSENAHTPSPSPQAPGAGLGKRFSIAFPSAAALIKRSKGPSSNTSRYHRRRRPRSRRTTSACLIEPAAHPGPGDFCAQRSPSEAVQ
jgi:hypothetical protein